MQRIAAEMNFSESTFIFPADGAGDVRMRIFTPAEELPMAGHPTIGSTFALAATGVIAAGQTDFVFELGVGPTPVSLEWKDGRLDFAWMTQPLPVFGTEAPRPDSPPHSGWMQRIPSQTFRRRSFPAAYRSSSSPLVSREAVDRVSIDRRAYVDACRKAGFDDVPVFLFTTDRSGATGDETVYSRMLAPAFGIVEDPATGSASGPLGCYLVRHGVLDAARARSFVSLQGVAMRRPSRLFISIESHDGAITRVRVGGRAVAVGAGELTV